MACSTKLSRVSSFRKRIYQAAARKVGVESTRPYDLRHSFVSLLIHEGRLSIVEIARQLGHSPTMALDTYGHVIANLTGKSLALRVVNETTYDFSGKPHAGPHGVGLQHATRIG